jgi:DNA-directed RNA polymerase subunit K/omega
MHSLFAEHEREVEMVKRPDGMNAFEFSVLSGLRATQLNRGCTPRVPRAAKLAVTAQHEIAERKVVRSLEPSEADPRLAE